MARRGESRRSKRSPQDHALMQTLLRLIEGAARYEAELIATERRIPPKERAAFIARRVGRLKQVRTARAILAKGSGPETRKRLTKKKGGK